MAKLCFKYATMNSGKTIDLIRTAYNYEENGFRVIVMKPKRDTKGLDKLNSRIGLERKVDVLINDETNIIDTIQKRINSNLKCIFIDEAELLSKEKIDELYLATKVFDIPIICYGLRTNFKMEGFEGAKRLLEIAESLEEIKTLCECGEIARYAGRKVDNLFTDKGEEIVIDGSCDNVKYVPLCGDCYLKKVKRINYRNLLK